MSFLKQGNWQWIKEKKKSRRGEITYAPTGVWVISVEDLNKILVDTFSSEFSRDVIWDVAKAKANLNGNQFRVRKAIPEHLTPVCRKTSGKWKPTRQEEKSIKRYMASFIEKRLEGFEKHFQDHIEDQKEKVEAEIKKLESPTFQSFAQEFYLPTQKSKKPESDLRIWAYPVIGHMKLDRIEPQHIDKVANRALNGFVKNGKRKSLAPNTAHRIVGRVKRVFNMAEEMDMRSYMDGREQHLLKGRRPHNPKLLQTKIKRERHTRPPPTANANASLLEYAQNTDEGVYYLLLTVLYSGLRIAEILALEWSDVRWEESKIEVTKQWSAELRVIKNTKTGLKETKRLVEDAMTALKDWQQTAPNYKEVAAQCSISASGQYKLMGVSGGTLPICTGKYIFSHPSGRPMLYSAMWGRLNKMQKALGIYRKGQGFHAFRRSLASELAAQLRQERKDPYYLLKKIFGWKSRDQMEEYIYDMDRHTDTETLEEAFAKLPYRKIIQRKVARKDKRENLLKVKTVECKTTGQKTEKWHIRISFTENRKRKFRERLTELDAVEETKSEAMKLAADFYKEMTGRDY